MIKYKDLSAVDLKRNSTVQYTRTRGTGGTPLPGACPTLAQLMPVFNSWPYDFSLLPNSDNLGPDWTPFNTIWTSLSNDSTTFVRGGLLQSGSDPVVNGGAGSPTDTSADPTMNYLTVVPFNVKDQIVSAAYQSTTFTAAVAGTNIGEFCVLGRFNVIGVGTRYDLNVKAYAANYEEVYNAAGVFQSAAVNITYWNNGSSVLAGAACPKLNAGELLTMTMANFRFSPTIEAVCLKVYTAGVQRAAFTDATANRILTGSMGCGAHADGNIPNNAYLYFNNFLAQQVGPNPT